MNALVEKEYKYPFWRNIIGLVTFLFLLFIVLSPIYFIYCQIKFLIKVGPSEYIDTAITFFQYIISHHHPLALIVMGVFLAFIIVSWIPMAISSISDAREMPYRFILTKDSLSFTYLFEKTLIKISDIIHVEESSSASPSGGFFYIYYRSGNKTNKASAFSLLINYNEFTSQLKEILIADHGFYYNKDFVKSKKTSKLSRVKAYAILFLIVAFSTLSMVAGRLDRHLEWDALTIVLIIFMSLLIPLVIFWSLCGSYDATYENGNIGIEYEIFKKRSFHIRIEDIQRAKKTNNTNYVIYYRRNNSLKKLTLDNKPIDGKDVLFAELRNRALLK